MKDRRSFFLLDEFIQFNFKLDVKNRRMKISGLIPCEEVEEYYDSYFLPLGYPFLDSRLLSGRYLLKRNMEVIRMCKKQMLQFLRQNIQQVEEIVLNMRKRGMLIEKKIAEEFNLVNKLFEKDYKLVLNIFIKIKYKL